jgi:DNA gyrase inhibitor GyrI
VAHHGSYAGLGDAWQEFMAAVATDGLAPDWSRPFFEVYVNEPGTVPDDELITELHQPVG